jgi:hypothetical protein
MTLSMKVSALAIVSPTCGHATFGALTSKASASRCERFNHGSIARGGTDNGAECGYLVWPRGTGDGIERDYLVSVG